MNTSPSLSQTRAPLPQSAEGPFHLLPDREDDHWQAALMRGEEIYFHGYVWAVEPRGQTRGGSFVETCINVAVGYAVAVVSSSVLFPFFGIQGSTTQILALSVPLTAVSVARSYCVRRLFNLLHRKGILK